MKRLLPLLTLAGAVAGAVWYARQQRGQQPAPATGGWAGKPKLQAVPEPTGSSVTTDRSEPPQEGVDPETKIPPVSSPFAADDLTGIKGIGPKYAQQLGALGITSFEALVRADPEMLSKHFGARARVEDWIAQARDRFPD